MDDNSRRLVSRLPVVLAMVSVAGLLGACGTDGEAKPPGKVASIASPAAEPAGGSAPAAAGTTGKRPQLRVDSSLDDEFRLEQAWYACWKKAGAPVDVVGPEQTPQGVTPQGQLLQPNIHKVAQVDREWQEDPAFAKALKECADLEPVPPAEFNSDTNPHFQDQYKAFILCLRSKGMKADATDGKQPGAINHLSFQFKDGADMPPNLETVRGQCESAAFKK